VDLVVTRPCSRLPTSEMVKVHLSPETRQNNPTDTSSVARLKTHPTGRRYCGDVLRLVCIVLARSKASLARESQASGNDESKPPFFFAFLIRGYTHILFPHHYLPLASKHTSHSLGKPTPKDPYLFSKAFLQLLYHHELDDLQPRDNSLLLRRHPYHRHHFVVPVENLRLRRLSDRKNDHTLCRLGR
jgi:hypothetical protein